MNTITKLGITILSTAAIAASLSANCNATNQMHAKTPTANQTVTISAKRMTAEEKAAFDQTSSANATQTVVISAKRLSPQAKIAFDRNSSAKLNQA